jgi:predicted O-linked N-acetylglucosamine transferase (SPINDLY family)
MHPLISDLFRQSFEHFQNDSLDLAENLVNKILQLDPINFDAFQILGIIKVGQNRPQEAIRAFESALRIKPFDHSLQFNLAKAHMDCGQHSEALVVHEKCLKLMPENPDVWINYGASHKILGRHEQALEAYKKAAELNSGDPEIWSNIAVCLNDLKHHTEALNIFDKALSINPHIPVTWYNKGITLEDLGLYAEAVHAYDRALSLQVNYPAAWSNRGGALILLKEYQEGISSYEKALYYEPTNFEILTNYGSALNEVGEFEGALIQYKRALEISPVYPKAWFNQGITFSELKRYSDAVNSFQNAKNLNPSMSYLLGNLVFNKATVCDWSNHDKAIEEIKTQINLGNNPTPPFYSLSILDSEELQLKIAKLWVKDNQPKNLLSNLNLSKSKSRKIKVGYFSGDFREHAVSYLLAGLFETHDKERFEIIGFSFNNYPEDKIQRRLILAFTEFIDISNLTDIEVANLAREMKIDIAVDLGGFTKNSRIGIFANRAAPIQINYLGYAGTTGAEFIDYIIADQHVIPESSQKYYSEKIIYLPNSFMANDCSRKISMNIPRRKDLGIPDNAFVFCCFNNSYKITPEVFLSWLNILEKTPGSVLWLSDTNLEAKNSLINFAKKSRVDSNRIIFAEKVIKNEDHLARLQVADLFLDTLPYNAHTTAADALWAGLPVLTCTGNTFAGRVATSLLSAIDLPSLITSSRDEYESCAIDIAHSPSKLNKLKESLGENKARSPLFNTRLFTKNLESAYQQIYEHLNSDLKQ